MSNHSTLTGIELHESFHYVASSDPGAVGAGKYWLDTTTATSPILKRRNAANDGWDTVGSAGGSVLGARVTRATAQSVADSTVTAIAWDSETRDDGGWHDNATNNSRLTVPTGKGGRWYLICACLRYASNATGRRNSAIRLNGTTNIVTQNILTVAATDAQKINMAGIYYLADADYVEVIAFQNSGGNLDVEVTNGESWFAIAPLPFV